MSPAVLRSRVMIITEYASMRDPQPACETLCPTWEYFVEYFQGRLTLAPKDVAPVWHPVELKPDTTRAKANVLQVHAVVLDLDDDDILNTAQRLAENSIRSIVHTTHSSAPGALKARFVLDVSRPILPHEYPDVWAYAFNTYAPLADPACKDASRGWYLPPQGRRFDQFAGEPLDVDWILTQAANTVVPEPDLNRPELWQQRVDRCPVGIDPKEHFIELAKTLPVAVHGEGGTALFDAACVGIVGLGLDHDDVDIILAEHWNPRCDPPWGAEDHANWYSQINDAATKSTRTVGYLKPRGTILHLTDASLAEVLAQEHAGTLRWCEDRKVWYRYDGKLWTKCTTPPHREVLSLARELQEEAANFPDDKKLARFRAALAYESARAVSSVVTMLKSHPDVLVSATDFDADLSLLNCSNGVLDLTTGRLLDHQAEYLMAQCTGVDYILGARSALWDGFIETITNGNAEQSQYIQRAAGLALTGRPEKEKAFFFLYGAPDTGKSKFLDALLSTLGSYATTTQFNTWLQQGGGGGGNRDDIVKLLGSRLVISSEVKPQAKLDSELIKQVTGGDMLTAAAKYERTIDIRPTFTLWWAANDRPRVRADDEGFWTRARILGCKNPVPKEKQNPNLSELWKEPEHAMAILAWAVRGALDYQRFGLGTCQAVELEKGEYRKSQDPCSEFFEDHVSYSATWPILNNMQIWIMWEQYSQTAGDPSTRWIKKKELLKKLDRHFNCSEERNEKGRGRKVTIKL